MYKRTIWQDHVEGIQEGTDMNAANFNNIEAGTMEANALAAMNSSLQRYAADMAKDREVVRIFHQFYYQPEELTSNPGYQTAFISLPADAIRNNVNYNVIPVVSYADHSPVGTILISDKQANGFVAQYNSEKLWECDVYFYVFGGMI